MSLIPRDSSSWCPSQVLAFSASLVYLGRDVDPNHSFPCVQIVDWSHIPACTISHPDNLTLQPELHSVDDDDVRQRLNDVDESFVCVDAGQNGVIDHWQWTNLMRHPSNLTSYAVVTVMWSYLTNIHWRCCCYYWDCAGSNCRVL